MPELDAFHVVRDRLLLFGHAHDLIDGNENEFSMRINELLDEPRTGDPVNLHLLARHPFHEALLPRWFNLKCSRVPTRGCTREAVGFAFIYRSCRRWEGNYRPSDPTASDISNHLF